MGVALRSRFRLTCFGLALSLLVGCASPIERAEWVVVSTENFEILSTMSAEDASELASDLERFRALIYTVTTAPRNDSPIRTKIVAFDRRGEYAPVRPKSGAYGYFIPGLRANEVALADFQGAASAREVILHEYVHFVLRDATDVVYPMWYDEGFAEVLSTAQTHKGQLAVGAVPETRIQIFRRDDWIPMQRVIEATSYGEFTEFELGLFYAQAWALAHYVVLDRLEENAFPRYMERLQRGEPPAEAFEGALGEPIQRAGLKIRGKIEDGNWRVIGIPLEKLEWNRDSLSARRPAPDEVSVHLGQLQLARREPEKAQELFEAALAADPSNARAHAGLGDALKFQSRWEEAEPHFRSSVELGPRDALNHLDLAEYLHDLALRKRGGPERKSLIEQSRAAYRESRRLDPSIPETDLMEGRTYLAAGEDASRSLQLIRRAYERLPSHEDTTRSMAEAYVATGRPEQARDVLRNAWAGRGQGSLRTNLDSAIEAIEKRRAREAAELTGESSSAG